MANTSISSEKELMVLFSIKSVFNIGLIVSNSAFFSRALHTQISFTVVNTVILHLHPYSLPQDFIFLFLRAFGSEDSSVKVLSVEDNINFAI